MSDVKWIKITTEIFDDEKFDAIETLADKHMIQLAWIKLLCLAGRCNDNGFLTLSNEIPYTNEMIANRFNMSVGDVQRALTLFQDLHMIEVVNNVYMVSNWLKYQNGDDLELIRQKHRERQQRYRDKQKALKLEQKEKRDVTGDVTSDVNCSIYISNISNSLLEDIKTIIDYLNLKTGKKYSYKTRETQNHIKARLDEGYTVDDFKRVIDAKCQDWLKDPQMNKYLRPNTLFLPSKFESYLNQSPATTEQVNIDYSEFLRSGDE